MAFEDKNDEVLLFDEDEDTRSGFLDDPEAKGDDTDIPVVEEEDLLAEDESKVEGNDNRPRGQAVRGLRATTSSQARAFQTDVDIVFVIDCTGSMEPFLTLVKKHAKTMHEDIVKGLGTVNRQVRKLRLKVIAYRDYYFDYVDPENPPMAESEFFTLPNELEAYTQFVDGLDYCGGEDEPESALEALHIAFNSAWQSDPDLNVKSRQIVMLFTDASAHPLDDPMRYDPEYNTAYPEGIPSSLEGLEEEYMSSEVFPPDRNGYPAGHRLVLFAPENMYPWNKMKDWEAASCKTMDPERGLDGVGMDDVIELIRGSIS